MAFPTSVNSQITDTVTQGNLIILGLAPAQAVGNLLQVASQTAALSMQNAVSNQQMMNQVTTAIVTRCVSNLTSGGSEDPSTAKI